jgi:pilus assembly protein Flp/PilA
MENTMDMLKTLSQALFVRLFTQLPGRARNQRGASALEYIVLAVVVVLVVAAGAVAISDNVGTVWENIGNALSSDAAEPASGG